MEIRAESGEGEGTMNCLSCPICVMLAAYGGQLNDLLWLMDHISHDQKLAMLRVAIQRTGAQLKVAA